MHASRTTTRHPESREDFIMAHPQDSKGRSRIPRPLWNRTNLDRKLFRQSQTFNRIGTPRFRLHMGRTTRRSLQYTQASPYHRASPANHRLFIRTTRGTLRGLKHHRRWIHSFTARRKGTQETCKIWIAPHERTRSKIFAAQTGTLWIIPRTSSLPPLYHWSQGFSCRSGRQIHQGNAQRPRSPA